MSLKTSYRNSIYQPRWGNIEFTQLVVENRLTEFSDEELFDKLKKTFFWGELSMNVTLSEYERSTFGNYQLETIHFENFTPLNQKGLKGLLKEFTDRNFVNSYGFSEIFIGQFSELIMNSAKLLLLGSTSFYSLNGAHLPKVFPEGGQYTYFDFFFATGNLLLNEQQYRTISTIRLEKE